MRQRPVVKLAVIAALGALLLVRAPLANAQTSAPDGAPSPCVGAWLLRITDQSSVPISIQVAFLADGNAVLAGPPASTSVANSGAGLGVWQDIGVGKCQTHLLRFETDVSGAWLDTREILALLTVTPDGNAIRGEGSVTVAAPDGSVLLQGETGPIAGQRFTLAPLAELSPTPGATPAP